MASLQGIKDRINSIKSIKKITHAMELVSFSKLKKAKLNYEEVTKYNVLIDNIFNKIFENLYEDELEELLMLRNKCPSKLYIIITSNMGLAGAYNSNIIKMTKNTIKKGDKIIVLGLYGLKEIMNSYSNQFLESFIYGDIYENHRFIKKVAKHSMNLYNKKEISSINIIYTKYINNLVQECVSEQIFPFDENKIREHIQKNAHDHNLEFEPSPKEVLKEAFPLYIDSKIYLALSCSKISEIAARRIAMENATDNANELINNLNIDYNKKRQTKITQELIEIVSGADAIK